MNPLRGLASDAEAIRRYTTSRYDVGAETVVVRRALE
jgi:hypothetical protein